MWPDSLPSSFQTVCVIAETFNSWHLQSPCTDSQLTLNKHLVSKAAELSFLVITKEQNKKKLSPASEYCWAEDSLFVPCLDSHMPLTSPYSLTTSLHTPTLCSEFCFYYGTYFISWHLFAYSLALYLDNGIFLFHLCNPSVWQTSYT